ERERAEQLGVDMAELGVFASPEAAVGAVIEQTPAGRLGDVSDMADAVVFLASDQARFITGGGLHVEREMGMWGPMGSLTDYLDKGASLGRIEPCLVEGDRSL